MKMIDGLAPVSSAVDDDPVAVVQSPLPGKVPYHHVEMANQCLVLILQGIERTDLLARDHQQVDWCLGVDIGECQAEIILMDNIGRDFAIDDPLEMNNYDFSYIWRHRFGANFLFLDGHVSHQDAYTNNWVEIFKIY